MISFLLFLNFLGTFLISLKVRTYDKYGQYLLPCTLILCDEGITNNQCAEEISQLNIDGAKSMTKNILSPKVIDKGMLYNSRE